MARNGTCILALGIAALPLRGAAQEVLPVYVAPATCVTLPPPPADGESEPDFGNAGLVSGQPVCNLADAQRVIRKKLGAIGHRNVEVLLRSGTYRRQRVTWTFTMPNHTIEFKPRDDTQPRPVFDGNDDAQNYALGSWFNLQTPGSSESTSDDPQDWPLPCNQLPAGGFTNLVFTGLTVQDYASAIKFSGDRRCEATRYNGNNIVRDSIFARIGLPPDHPYTIDEDGNRVYPDVVSAIGPTNSDDNIITNNYFTEIKTPGKQYLLHAVYFAHDSSGNEVSGNVFENAPGDTLKVRDFSNDNVFYNNTLVGPRMEQTLLSGHCNPAYGPCTKQGRPECMSWNAEFTQNRVASYVPANFYTWMARVPDDKSDPTDNNEANRPILPDGQGCAALKPPGATNFIMENNQAVGATAPRVTLFRGAEPAAGTSATWAASTMRLNATQVADQSWLSGDFNGDGRGDMLAVFRGADDKAATRLFLGRWQTPAVTGKLSSLTASFWVGPQWLSADLDGTPGDELALVYTNGSGEATVWVYRWNGSSFTRIAAQPLDVPFGGAARALVGNFDGTVGHELAVVYPDEDTGIAQIEVFRLGGSTFTRLFEQPMLASFNGTRRWLVGNFDGSGADDIALVYGHRDATGTMMSTLWLYRSNGGSFTRTVQQDLTAQFDDSQKWLAGDFDQDGRGEVALVYSPDGSSASSWVYQLSGGSFTRRLSDALGVPFASGSQWLVIDHGPVDDLLSVMPTD